MLFGLVLVIKEKLGITIELVNLGGGFGIPYRPEEKVIDVQAPLADSAATFLKIFSSEQVLGVVDPLFQLVPWESNFLFSTCGMLWPCFHYLSLQICTMTGANFVLSLGAKRHRCYSLLFGGVCCVSVVC